MSQSPPALATVAVLSLTMAFHGCAFTPRSRLEDCHKLSRGLQSEVVQLRDSEVRIRAQYQDLVERSVTDQRRLASLEEYVQQQDRSIQSYQEDREKLAAELERVLRVVRNPGGVPTALNERLRTFALAHPGVVHQSEASACAFPIHRLFVSGTDILTPLGRDWLRDFDKTVGDFDPVGLVYRVSEQPSADGVVRASFDPLDELAGRHVERIREWLTAEGSRHPGSVVIAGTPGGPPGSISIGLNPSPALNSSP